MAATVRLSGPGRERIRGRVPCAKVVVSQCRHNAPALRAGNEGKTMSTSFTVNLLETPAPQEAVVMRFDPFDCGCDDTAAIFRDETARTLYLLWRRGHIVSQYFPARVREIAERIRGQQPKTVEELILMFPRGPMDFHRKDVEGFCAEFVDYFTGVRPPVEYRVELSA